MEKTGNYALAAVGAAQGFFKYYIRPELTAPRAWAVIGLGVLAYEAACPKGELLSEGMDRAIEKYPKAVPLAIGAVALHLMNKFPDKIDPFTNGLNILKGV